MKKIITLLLVITCVALCGCSPEETVAPELQDSITEAEPEKPVADEFYTRYTEDSLRPFAVMIDNDGNDSRPHAGLADAYLIYEITVEGGATRMMALFSGDTKVEKIGPVRSSRHYFLDYAAEHDAIYVHFGWSPKAQSDIPALGINNINGLTEDGTTFWRERKYAGDYHSAYTSYEKIVKSAEAASYRTKRQEAPLNFSETIEVPEGNDCNEVYIPYAGFYSVSYIYNAETSLYDRYINGAPHPVQDKAIATQNIIIMKMSHVPLGDTSGRIDIGDVGSGEGYYISCGKSVPITWSKQSRTAPTVFKDGAGNELRLNPGKTFIQVISGSHNISLN